MKIMMKLVVLCFIFACGGSGKNTSDPEKAGEKAFASGNYDEALDHFLDLADTDPVAGYTGAGWSALRLHDYSDANTYFQNIAVSKSVDAYAGWSITGWALSDFSQAIQRADTVLSKNAGFVLTLDDGVTANDLILVQALCYYESNNFSATLQKIKILDSGFNADLNAPDIAQVLAVKLEQLSAVFSKSFAKGF